MRTWGSGWCLPVFSSLTLYFVQRMQKMEINEWKLCNFSTFWLWPENVSIEIYTLKRLIPHIIIVWMIIMSVCMLFAICFFVRKHNIACCSLCEHIFLNENECTWSNYKSRMLNRFIEPDRRTLSASGKCANAVVLLIEFIELKVENLNRKSSFW